MIIILRPKGLGRESCNGIVEKFKEISDESIEVVRSDQYVYSEGDRVFRWGCTKMTPYDLVNTRDSIIYASDKALFRYHAYKDGISMETWTDFGKFLDDRPEGKMVVRPSRHKQGKDLYVCEEYSDIFGVIQNLGDDYYISRLIDKVKEYRVVVFDDRILYIYEKVPSNPEDVAWNHAQGSTSENIRWGSWPLLVANKALRAMALSGLDFGAVDIIVDRDGNAYVLEVNTAPETTSPYRQTCIAKALKYRIDIGFPSTFLYAFCEDIENLTWKDYIHPALSELANV